MQWIKKKKKNWITDSTALEENLGAGFHPYFYFRDICFLVPLNWSHPRGAGFLFRGGFSSRETGVFCARNFVWNLRGDMKRMMELESSSDEGKNSTVKYMDSLSGL